jgi:hypothetical protein
MYVYVYVCIYIRTTSLEKFVSNVPVFVLLNLYVFHQLHFTLRRIHTGCNALHATQYVLTEVNLHLRNYAVSLTVMLLNFCAMKVI